MPPPRSVMLKTKRSDEKPRATFYRRIKSFVLTEIVTLIGGNRFDCLLCWCSMVALEEKKRWLEFRCFFDLLECVLENFRNNILKCRCHVRKSAVPMSIDRHLRRITIDRFKHFSRNEHDVSRGTTSNNTHRRLFAVDWMKSLGEKLIQIAPM